MISSKQDHEWFMRRALELGREGLGRVWPNPSVGCVIVRDGGIIAQARTADGGRPHAEALALLQAGGLARGADVYVTLEPCAHFGVTPPCTQALVDAGVRRVVTACGDPDPRVSGQGLAMLGKAGIEVVSGVLEAEALQDHLGFMLRVTEGRPMVTLKLAISADGKIAAAPGLRTAITGPEAQARMHRERAVHDAVLVGVGTALADDPMLNARVPEINHETVRVILDANLRLPAAARLRRRADQFPLWVVHACPDQEKQKALENAGAQLVAHDPHDVGGVLKALAKRGITRLMVEGGSAVAGSFIKSGFVDRFALFRSPEVMGSEGLNAIQGLSIAEALAEAGLNLEKTEACGEDLLEIYARRA